MKLASKLVEPGLLTIDQASSYLGLEPITLKRLLRRKDTGPKFILLDEVHVRYLKSDLDTYINQCRAN